MRPRAMWSSLDLFWGVPAVLSKSALLREAAVLIEVPFLSKGALDLLQSRVVLPSVRPRRKYARQAAAVNATSQQTLPRSVIGSSLRTLYPVAMFSGVLGEQAPKSHSRWSGPDSLPILAQSPPATLKLRLLTFQFHVALPRRCGSDVRKPLQGGRSTFDDEVKYYYVHHGNAFPQKGSAGRESS